MTSRKPTTLHVGEKAKPDPAALKALAATEPGGAVVQAPKIDSEGVNGPVAGSPAVQAPTPAPESIEPVAAPAIDSETLRRYVVKRVLRVPMTIRVPEPLYADLQMIQKFGGKTMTDVLVEAAIPVVAGLVAKIGDKKGGF